ncbi:MAG TPA: autotransporter-associated beta strand repeat-containing protein, partial [Candidatus Sulfotelmatobacter sp.]|nr:autotransporter-associated beta strand repeat-containing protein [Candidatus Sulfotelmatobacter sp.]
MKKTPDKQTTKAVQIRALLILSALIFAPGLVLADVEVWSGNPSVTATTNWSDTANWSGTSHNPNNNDLKFFNNGLAGTQGTVDNVVDKSTNCNSLACANTNAGFHTTLIQPGQSLYIDGNTGGNSIIASTLEVNTALTEYTTIDGTNATLKLGGSSMGAIFVGQGGTGTGAKATLDMQGLDTFMVTNATRMEIGVGNTRYCGVLYLAKTNFITLTNGSSPELDIGDNSGNNGSGSLLYLGITNVINVDSIGMGLKKQNSGSSGIHFNPAFTNQGPAVYFRGANTTGPVNTWAIGDGTGASSTDTETGLADFTGGTINALVNSLWLALPSGAASGGYTANGTLTLTAGSINVNNLTNASLASSTGPETATGVINVSGGTLSVNNFVMAALMGFTGTAKGTLNITNGAVYVGTLVPGGGTSTINNAGGTLVITNGAGTIVLPITTAYTSNALWQVSVASLNPEVAATTLNTDGTTNVINIASLPAITSYPQQFPIIHYSGSIGGVGFNFGLGTLPTGSPAYEGYISNNTSSVDLVLTSGPVPIGLDVWNGTVNSNWDLTTLNWTNLGVAVAFHAGDAVQFDDTDHGPTNVFLTTNLLNPSSVTVSNNNLNYSFGGPGGLGISATLVKAGTGTLLFTNTGTNIFAGGITINAGMIQFGNGGTGGNWPANNQPVSDNANLVLDLSPNFSVQNTIAGTGNLTQSGGGVVSLSASNSYTGLTSVKAGTLLVDGYIGGGGIVTNATGTTLGGTGGINGTLNANGNLNPGDVNGAGTLTVNGNTTLYPAATGTFDLNANNTTTGSGVNDLLVVNGNLNASNTTISVNIQGLPQNNTYTVMNYSGTLNGTFNSTVAGTHYTANVDTSNGGQVNVVVTGSSGANLKWNSTGSGSWDNVTQNWLNLGTSLADNFYSGDTVLMDDSVANVVTNLVIPPGTTNYPTAITNNANIYNYSIGGGAIGGAASLVKNGTDTLIISNANTFTGTVDVYGGTLMTANGSALGTTAGGTTVHPGATLDVDGSNLGSETVTVSGAGVGGLGAIVNSGLSQINAFKNVTLAGDTTFGGNSTLTNAGAGRWDIRGGSATLQASGSPVNITKVGPNQVSLVACTCNDGNLENVDIQQGELALQTTTTQFGDPNGFITVHINAILDVYALTAGLNKNIVLQGGGEFLSENGSTTISGTVILTNAASQGIFTNLSGTTLNVNSVIEGPGGFVKRGSGITQITAANTYTGATSVGGGTLLVGSAASIATTPSFSISSGATLDVTAFAPWTLTSQTLTGSGLVIGNFTADTGSTVAPGTTSTVGTLTDAGNVTLTGTNNMKVSRVSGATNDVLAATNTLTLGGVLNVTSLGGTYQGGDTFTLFVATNGLSGTFSATNLPVLSAGLAWVTTNLANGV